MGRQRMWHWSALLGNVGGETELAYAEQYQDADDHEGAAEQDGCSDLEPFVKAMAHPRDDI